MRAYATGRRCLMEVLTEALDDPAAGACGRCSVCTGAVPYPGRGPLPDGMAAAREHVRGRRHILEPRKLWPAGVGRRGRIAGLEPGRAVAFADDPAWPLLIAEIASPDAAPGDELRHALVEVLVRWSKEWVRRPAAVVPIPSRSRPKRVQGMAQHLAEVCRRPAVDALRIDGDPATQDVASPPPGP